MQKNKKGFTLIEILIVIAIIAILALVVLVALNPVERFADARNSTRISNVSAVGNAILQYSADHGGSYPSMIPLLVVNASTNAEGIITATNDPNCTYASVVAGDNSNATDVSAGCMWADYSTLSSAISQYLATVPSDTGTYAHLFVALTADNAHVVVMSDDMESNGVNTDPSKSALYFKIF